MGHEQDLPTIEEISFILAGEHYVKWPKGINYTIKRDMIKRATESIVIKTWKELWDGDGLNKLSSHIKINLHTYSQRVINEGSGC